MARDTESWRVRSLPPAWVRTTQRILRRDGYRCYLCKSVASEVDHVVPASQGGGDEDSNLAAICLRCHRSKTGREGRAAQPRRARDPEPHPGVCPSPGLQD